MQYDYIIIGGGIIGLSTAMQLKQKQSNLKILVLEKESQLNKHQTGHNSGVIHAGVYYKPGSMRANFCKQGVKATKAFCTQNQIKFQTPGKIIAATSVKEDGWLESLLARCNENDIETKLLSKSQIQTMQPGLFATSAFFVPSTGIVDWQKVGNCYAFIFKELGGEIFVNEQTQKIIENEQNVSVISNITTHKSRYVITCAGLHADRMIRASGQKPAFSIMPFRGEYYKLKQSVAKRYKRLIYPVPDPSLPFLGVHFTPMVSGEVTVGPNAVLALAREGYSWSDLNFTDMVENLSNTAFWRMIWSHHKAAIKELKSSISKKAYLKQLRKYDSSITLKDIEPYPSGVRAQALDQQGQLIHDFLFQSSERILHTCNTPSPAATSSLPIGNYISDKALELYL